MAAAGVGAAAAAPEAGEAGRRLSAAPEAVEAGRRLLVPAAAGVSNGAVAAATGAERATGATGAERAAPPTPS